MLAHIGGVPVQESLLYVAPVLAVVGWMYYAGWRERRNHSHEPEAGDHDAQQIQGGHEVREEATQVHPVSPPGPSGR